MIWLLSLYSKGCCTRYALTNNPKHALKVILDVMIDQMEFTTADEILDKVLLVDADAKRLLALARDGGAYYSPVFETVFGMQRL